MATESAQMIERLDPNWRAMFGAPLQCSQGGIPFNKSHLDAKDTDMEASVSASWTHDRNIEQLTDELGQAREEIERLHFALDVIREELARVINQGAMLALIDELKKDRR